MNLTRRRFVKLLGTTALTAITRNKALSSEKASITEVKVAYPPTMAALPLVKGAQQKFFLKEDSVNPFLDQNIELTLIPSKGSSDAARLVSGGRADCSITGLSSSLYAIQNTGNLKITSTIFNPNKAGRYLGLVTNSSGGFSTLSDLVENGLSSSTSESIILSLRRDDHYATDQLLEKAGFSGKDSTYYVEQEDLIARLTGLIFDNFISSVLSEPLLTLALDAPEFQSYRISLLSDYSDVNIPPFVLAFNSKILEEKPELVKRFHRGWNNATEQTNSSTNLQLLDLTTEILLETLPSLRSAIEGTEFSKEFANIFEIPDFSRPEPLDRETFGAVLNWTISKGYLQGKIPFKKVYYGSSSVLNDKSK